jgi:hypothetical protein
MARNHGRILTAIWSDPDFRALPPDPQRLYVCLVTQPNLNHAGVLPLTLRRWANMAAGLTPGEVQEALDVLDDTRFVVVDEDTEEVLIRTLIRHDQVWRQPYVMLAAEGDALSIESPRLRGVLMRELDRLDLSVLSDEPGKKGESARAIVAGVVGRVREAFGDLPPDPPVRVRERVEETLSERVSDTLLNRGSGPRPAIPLGGERAVFPALSGDGAAAPGEDSDETAAHSTLEEGAADPPGEGVREGAADPSARALTAPSPSPSPKPHKSKSSLSATASHDDDPIRETVEMLCRHLADRIEENGSRRPAITQKWRDAARLMITKDERTIEQVLGCIDWCQADEFWRSNILSMPKMREKYDQLRLAAKRRPGPSHTSATSPSSRRQQETDDMFTRALARAAAREETTNDTHRDGTVVPLRQGMLPSASHG